MYDLNLEHLEDSVGKTDDARELSRLLDNVERLTLQAQVCVNVI